MKSLRPKSSSSVFAPRGSYRRPVLVTAEQGLEIVFPPADFIPGVNATKGIGTVTAAGVPNGVRGVPATGSAGVLLGHQPQVVDVGAGEAQDGLTPVTITL